MKQDFKTEKQFWPSKPVQVLDQTDRQNHLSLSLYTQTDTTAHFKPWKQDFKTEKQFWPSKPVQVSAQTDRQPFISLPLHTNRHHYSFQTMKQVFKTEKQFWPSKPVQVLDQTDRQNHLSLSLYTHKQTPLLILSHETRFQNWKTVLAIKTSSGLRSNRQTEPFISLPLQTNRHHYSFQTMKQDFKTKNWRTVLAIKTCTRLW